MDVGDVVTPKKEWLDPGEGYRKNFYMVIEDFGDRVKVRHLGSKLPLPSVHVYSKEWVEVFATKEELDELKK